jgi:hypothetical protein
MIATHLTTAQTGVWPGDCQVYTLDEPHSGFSSLAVCVLDYPGLQAVEILGATAVGEQAPGEDGALQSLAKLDFMTHADALAAIGYTIEEVAE